MSLQCYRLTLPPGLNGSDLKFTRQIGDAWLASRETPLARVPSAIAPQTWNYLLNPEHPDAKQVQVAEVIKERFDNRLFRFGDAVSGLGCHSVPAGFGGLQMAQGRAFMVISQ